MRIFGLKIELNQTINDLIATFIVPMLLAGSVFATLVYARLVTAKEGAFAVVILCIGNYVYTCSEGSWWRRAILYIICVSILGFLARVYLYLNL